MKRLTIFLLFSFLQINLFSQSNIKVGEKAPAIIITDWIANIPKDKKLTNKNIVLEFWATWCGPCIAAVPHMDSLQEKFKKSGIYFISITDEPKQKVENLLKRISFTSIVVSDQSKNTQVQFGDGKEGIPSIPLTVLINKKGMVSWIGYPLLLTDSILKDFMDGKIILSSIDADIIASGEQNNKEDSLAENKTLDLLSDKDILYSFEFKISKSKIQLSTMVDSRFIEFKASGILDLISAFSGKEKDKISIPENLKNKTYDLLYKNLASKENNLPQIEDAVLKSLGLKKEIVNKKVNVYEVTASNVKLLEVTLDTNTSSKSSAGANLLLNRYKIKNLILNAEKNNIDTRSKKNY